MTTLVGHADVCPECVADIDPNNHTYNPTTGTTYCSPKCWSEAVFGGNE